MNLDYQQKYSKHHLTYHIIELLYLILSPMCSSMFQPATELQSSHSRTSS